MNWDIIQRKLASATAYQLQQVRTLITRLIDDPARVAASAAACGRAWSFDIGTPSRWPKSKGGFSN